MERTDDPGNTVFKPEKKLKSIQRVGENFKVEMNLFGKCFKIRKYFVLLNKIFAHYVMSCLSIGLNPLTQTMAN